MVWDLKPTIQITKHEVAAALPGFIPAMGMVEFTHTHTLQIYSVCTFYYYGFNFVVFHLCEFLFVSAIAVDICKGKYIQSVYFLIFIFRIFTCQLLSYGYLLRKVVVRTSVPIQPGILSLSKQALK